MREALKLALEALELMYACYVNPKWVSHKQQESQILEQTLATITAIKEALEQPEQEQSGFFSREAMKAHSDFHVAQPEQEPVKYSKEQMQIYADANYEAGYTTGYMDCAVKTHQDKNPVAYVKASELEELKHCNGMNLWAENAAIHTDDSISKQLLPSGHVPIYTTPPQRKPLTDEDKAQCIQATAKRGSTYELISAIEAKLREKNT